MVHVSSLAVLASAVLSATALDIDFSRYSRDQCQDTYHIRKDTNLHDPHCKTFSEHEPPFSSFKVKVDGDSEDLTNKFCYVTVYEGKECTGDSMKYTQLQNFQEQCEETQTLQGRSVKVSCDERPVSTSTQRTVTDPATVGTVIESKHTVTQKEVTTMVAHPQFTTIARPAYTTVAAIPAEEWDWCPIVNTYMADGDNDDNDSSAPKGMRRVKRGTAC